MRRSRSDLGGLIGVANQLYGSVLDDSAWLPALQSAAAFVGGTAVFTVTADPTTGQITHSEGVGLDPIVSTLYTRYYASKEIRLPAALQIERGTVVTEEQLIDKRTYRRSELYADLLLPYDIPHIAMLWTQKLPTACSAVVIEQSLRHGPFQREHVERLQALVPHLLRTIAVRRQLAVARGQLLPYQTVIDSLPIGVAVLADDGAVVAASPTAESLFNAGQALCCTNRRLHAAYPEDDRRLQVAIRSCVTASNERSAQGASLAVRRVGGGGP